MAKTEDFDVVIIGSGVSGMVCGCYLQKAGLKVAVLEAREEAGGGRMGHELMRPGYVVQPCVWGEMDYIMPHQLNLELDKYGYQAIEMAADWGWATHFSDGSCLINNCWDYHKTAEKVRRFSEKDAKKVLEIGGFLASPYDNIVSRGEKFMELLFAAPWTWENFDILVNLLAPLLPFNDPYEITDLNGFEMMDMMFESDQLKVFTGYLALGAGFYPFNTGGAGSLGVFFGLGGFYGHPKNGIHSMAHVYIRCFRALGGKLFNSSPVKKIIVAGGEAKGVVLSDDAAFPGKEITAKKVVTNLNPRLTFTELVGEEHVGKKVIQQLKTNWKGDGILVNICFALKERPRFVSEKYDPDVVHSLAGAMGGDTIKEMIHAHGERMAGRISEHPILTYGLPHKDDPTQTRPDNCIISVVFEAPYAIYEKGGERIWDDPDFRGVIVKKCIDIWDKYSLDFKNNIVDYWLSTPVDHQRINPNYLRGCMFGGSASAHQMFYANKSNIEGFDKGGVVTPIKNLYRSGCLGTTDSTGGNGYRAACCIAEELGIRNQPWWTHRVYEYVKRKYIEKSYVPLKPTSILYR